MRVYVIATGAVFASLTVAHLWRLSKEPQLASDPWFVLATVIAAALAIVAWRVARRTAR